MDTLARFFETICISNDGAPAKVSVDPKFASPELKTALDYFWIPLQARPAHRHDKTGSFKQNHAAVRDL